MTSAGTGFVKTADVIWGSIDLIRADQTVTLLAITLLNEP